MTNKLKNIFSSNKENKGKILFENEEARKNFEVAVKEMMESGEAKNISGVKAIETFIKKDNNSMPLIKDDGFTEVIIQPSKELVEFDLETDYGVFCLEFERTSLIDRVVLESKEKSTLYIRMEFREKDKVTLNYRLDERKCSTVKELRKYHQVIWKFLCKMFYSHENGETFDKRIELIKNIDLYLGKIIELEEHLNLSFNPSYFTYNTKETFAFYELYFLLIKKVPIRINENGFSMGFDWNMKESRPEIQVGDKMAYLHYNYKRTINLFSLDIDVYTLVFAFNCIVDSIIDNNTDEGVTHTINFVGNDINPMYISYSGFLNEECLDNETKKNIEDICEGYKFAKTLNELIEEKNQN